MLVKEMISPYIHQGDIVVDLTAGNGNDTLFLAQKVGAMGKVYAFDIQETALENTRKLLADNDVLTQVTLIHAGHECFNEHVHEIVQCGMFNLGYLPRGDTKAITKPETTCLALKRVLKQLSIDGMVSIVSYYGHEGGLEEKLELENLLVHLDEKNFDVMTIFYPNRQNFSPIMHFIRKKK